MTADEECAAIEKGPVMKVSDEQWMAEMAALKSQYDVARQAGIREGIEMAAGVIENECDELTFEQRNAAARKVRALAGKGE